MEENNEKQDFNEHFIQLVIGLQSTAWMAMGKTMNPMNGKIEVNIDLAKDSIDTLLMLKEKTKGNLSDTEKNFLEGPLQDLQLNFIDVLKEEEKKKGQESKEKIENKNQDSEKTDEETNQ